MIEHCRDISGFTNGCGQFSQCEFTTTKGYYECIHDSAFEDNAWIGVIYSFVPPFIGIAILGGLGGGILKGPFLEVMLNYSQKAATHISYCFMFGGTLLNTVLLLFERHPLEPNRPIINFDIAIIFNLAIPLSTNIGSNLADYLPQLYVLIFQVIFLIIASSIIYIKAVQQRDLEQKLKEQPPQINHSLSFLNDDNDCHNQTLMRQFDAERNNKFPLISLGIITFTFILNQVIIQMRTEGLQKSIVGIQPCTLMNTMVLVLLAVANIIYTTIIWFYGRRIEYQKDQIKYRPDERYFTPFSRFILIYCGGFAGGFLSGFLGLGAGLVMVPVLIQCGLIARAASSTSAFNYFWISLNNLATLLTQQLLPWNQIGLFTILSLIGGSVFSKLGYYLMNKYKIGYIVIFFVFWLGVANIFSSVYYGVVSGLRYTMAYLTTVSSEC